MLFFSWNFNRLSCFVWSILLDQQKQQHLASNIAKRCKRATFEGKNYMEIYCFLNILSVIDFRNIAQIESKQVKNRNSIIILKSPMRDLSQWSFVAKKISNIKKFSMKRSMYLIHIVDSSILHNNQKDNLNKLSSFSN